MGFLYNDAGIICYFENDPRCRSEKVGQRPFVYPRLGCIFWLGLLSCAVVTAQALDPSPPQQVGMSGERLNRLDEVIRAAIGEEEIPGAVVLVAREGRVSVPQGLWISGSGAG